MIHQISVTCEAPEGMKPLYEWGALLHGVLFKRVPSDICELLHENGKLRPFSQHVELLPDNRFLWQIYCWDARVGVALEEAVCLLAETPLFVKDQMRPAKILQRQVDLLDEVSVLSGALGDDLEKRFEIRFMTPTAYKSDGAYAVFPSIRFLYQNLMWRFPAENSFQSLLSSVTVQQLCDHTRVHQYSISSKTYSIKNVRIPGHIGYMTLAVQGPKSDVQSATVLLSMAEYMGVGIKTAMGMGGCRVLALPPPMHRL